MLVHVLVHVLVYVLFACLFLQFNRIHVPALPPAAGDEQRALCELRALVWGGLKMLVGGGITSESHLC